MVPLLTVRAAVLIVFAAVVGITVTQLYRSSHKGRAKALLVGGAAAVVALLGANALVGLD